VFKKNGRETSKDISPLPSGGVIGNNLTKGNNMQLYEYICRKCHKKFGEVLTIKEHESKKIECPKCHSKDLEKVIEPFVAVTSKKSGTW